jgi:hypothetical protein
VVDQAKKAVQIEKNFWEEQNKRRLKQDTLTAKLHEKETKIHQLTGENEEVRSQLETVKKGIQKKTINYGISDEAKKILGL